MTPELLDAFEPAPTKPPSFRDIMALFALFPSARPLGSELRAFQRERVIKKPHWRITILVKCHSGAFRAKDVTNDLA